MASKIYYQEDCNLSLLEGKTIAIIGYGSQGHAHAENLKDSGCNVIVGLYEGSKSWAKAEAQGFKVYTAAEAAKKADIIMILINDEMCIRDRRHTPLSYVLLTFLIIAHLLRKCKYFFQIFLKVSSTKKIIE